MAAEGGKAALWRGGQEMVPDLAELCRIHEVGLDLIERSHDVDELLNRVLEEYERRLRELPGDALDGRAGKPGPESVRKLRALVMFATQAAALKEKAVAASELKRRAAEAESHRARLEGVLGALGSGVMILGAGGETHEVIENRRIGRVRWTAPEGDVWAVLADVERQVERRTRGDSIDECRVEAAHFVGRETGMRDDLGQRNRARGTHRVDRQLRCRCDQVGDVDPVAEHHFGVER